MKTNLFTRLTSLILLTLFILPTMMPVLGVFAADEIVTYVLDISQLDDMPANANNAGTTSNHGDENLFTLHHSAKSKIDSSKKTYIDGTTATKRFNMQGATQWGENPSPAISFFTQASAEVKVWWVSGGANRILTLWDSDHNAIDHSELLINDKDGNPMDSVSTSNLLCISTFKTTDAGTFFIGCEQGSDYIFRVEVTTKKLEIVRADWSTVANPVITKVATDNESGQLEVNINGLVGIDGADALYVNLIKDGKVVSTAKSTSFTDEHVLRFSPISSGDYSVEAVLSREGEIDKVSTHVSTSYLVPLTAPYVTNVTNLGSGKTLVVWNPVREAEKYEVVVNGGAVQTVTDREITLEGLPTGENTIQITAISGDRKTAAEAVSFKVTANAELGWNYVIYGPSAKNSNNSLSFDKDGNPVLSSTNNGGKLQPTGADGLGFYYTAIPTDKNFTFRVTIDVNEWTFTNGQEGFGLMVTDHVPSGDYQDGNFWTNQYQTLCTKIEYWYATDEEGNYYLYDESVEGAVKYSMKLGVGTISKTGIDQSIIDRTALGETGLIVGQNGYLKTLTKSFERSAGFINMDAGAYNVIGNWSGNNAPEGTLDEEYLITEVTFEIQKNNTGYIMRYLDQNGNVLKEYMNYMNFDEDMQDYTKYDDVKSYDPLAQFDSDYIYLGMFTARYATATFKDISLTIIDKEDDAPTEQRPVDYITPSVTVTSTNAISSSNYEFVADTNLDGVVELKINNTVIKSQHVKKFERYTEVFDLSKYLEVGENKLYVSFIPDAEQELDPYTELHPMIKSAYFEDTLVYFKGSYHTKTIYVSPTGLYNGNGTRENPYDIYTAVNRVIPGQTIVLMEGTYILKEGLRIQRGMNGTETDPIRMIADPEATTRPVLDFNNEGTGITHGGNWWYFYGFDVTNTSVQLASKGFQISGNNNIVENVHTYKNGNTGLQISRYHTVDIYKDQWPANNLILNCTSWGNADKGGEDADGFAAKLTIGDGNVFDGCIAYYNADDGWDLYAKVATGPIGSVTIKNSIAFRNGYRLDGGKEGNGNGFKLGGDSLAAGHKLINCIAFYNKQKGIDSNSCPDITVENCISYNNGSYNVAFYTNDATNTDYSGTGIISFKDDDIINVHSTMGLSLESLLVGDNLKPKGNQDTDKYSNALNYFWNGTTSSNTNKGTVTADMFVSLEFTEITRNEDGSINLNGFLELKDTAPENAGADLSKFTPLSDVVLVPDLEHNIGEWTSDDPYMHWQECDCGFKAHLGEHTFEYVIDEEPTAYQPGWKHNECTVCGYSKPQIEIPPLGGEEPPVPQPPVQPGEPEEPSAPNIFEDFGGWLTWLFQMIANFFANLFGGKA